MAHTETLGGEDVRTEEGRTPSVVAVVLTWNDVEMTEVCIESVLNNTHLPIRVVLVDNGSAFPTIEPLKKKFPEIDTIQLDENLGFTGGCNRGLERGLELDAEYLFLLNNDTIVDKNAIAELVQAMEDHQDAAAASALLIYEGAEKRIQQYGGSVFRDRAWLHRPGEDEPVTEEWRRVVETEFIPACAVLFRSEALREVGIFDESLFTNWEDYDLCLRIADANWKLLIAGTAEVVHRVSQTTGASSPFITYFSIRNRLICLFRFGSPLGILLNSPFIVRSFYWKVRSYGFGNVECHKAFAKGIFHFLIGIRGKGTAPNNRDDARTGKKRYT